MSGSDINKLDMEIWPNKQPGNFMLTYLWEKISADDYILGQQLVPSQVDEWKYRIVFYSCRIIGIKMYLKATGMEAMIHNICSKSRVIYAIINPLLQQCWGDNQMIIVIYNWQLKQFQWCSNSFYSQKGNRKEQHARFSKMQQYLGTILFGSRIQACMTIFLHKN